MTATAARRFGPYEFIAPLGAGGMGEVFRARDTRLGREVAIKVLPVAFSADPERLRRFEQEARAAAGLNHPALMAVYDIGTENGAPYIVSELLEGATLRHCLSEGRMPLRKAIDYGAQMARGLAAAHEKGIVHRDLKPENIFITRDGRAKILDFGLAKLVERDAQSSVSETQTMAREETTPGLVLGTAGYMSPEQVRGQAVDHRSDIFSFGAILYEVLSGERAFKGATAADTMTAILREDPPDLTTTATGSNASASIPAALDQIVRHCLQKEPQQRFQSASDTAFYLESLSTATSGAASALRGRAITSSPIPGMSRRMFFATVGTLALIGAFFLGHRLASLSGAAPLPQYKPITYQQGTINSARFSPDGQTMFCAARFGKKFELYSGRLDSEGLRPLGIDASEVLSVSTAGGIAFLEEERALGGFAMAGTLASVPLGGGSPKRILNDVQSADWSRDGSGLAVARFLPEKHVYRLEYPIGKVLYQTDGYISHLRFSPDGKTLAFLDHPIFGDDQGVVAVISASGGMVKRITSSFSSTQGLAWRPDGGELWFTGAKLASNQRSLYAVMLASPVTRLLQTGPVDMIIDDIASSGQALVNSNDRRIVGMVSTVGHPEEQDLAWFDWTTTFLFSNDGKQLLLSDSGSHGGVNYSTFLRNVDGSPAVRLGDGGGLALSPDGQWAISYLPQAPAQLLLLPTGAGEARQLTHSKLDHGRAGWFPDGKRIVFTDESRTYLLDLNGNETALTPEGIVGVLVTPDGQSVLVKTRAGKYELYPVAGGEPKPLEWLRENDAPIRFSGDGRSLFVVASEKGSSDIILSRVEFADGKRTLLRHVQQPQNAYSGRILGVDVTPDGTGYAYGYAQTRSALYVVSGLR
ncbi:MAG: protein kinase [Acidobacteriaceae bacterium]